MAEYLNNNIKYLRNLNNVSQQALADKIGVDRSTISRIENGEIETTIDNAIKIAEALDIPLNDLVGKDLKSKQMKETMNQELLFNKDKKYLTSSDWNIINTIVEARKKEQNKD